MLGDAIALVAVGLVMVGPIVWQVFRDRRDDKALQLQAQLQWKANQRLGGETFLVVTVQQPLAGKGGRVVLTVPAGWHWLVQEAWNEIRRATPPGYDIVVSGVTGRDDVPVGAAARAAGRQARTAAHAG